MSFAGKIIAYHKLDHIPNQIYISRMVVGGRRTLGHLGKSVRTAIRPREDEIMKREDPRFRCPIPEDDIQKRGLPDLAWDLSLDRIEIEPAEVEEDIALEAFPVAVAA